MTKQLPFGPDVQAPDGSDVRILVGTERGSMAHFKLGPDAVSKAITHRTVDEVWYCVAGSGQMWRRCGENEEIVELLVGTSLTIPVGTHFQFRAGDEGLSAVAVTIPPWPGEDEAVFVEGVW